MRRSATEPTDWHDIEERRFANELRVDALVREGAPIDIFGVGTDMSVSADAPCLDVAYNMTEFAGRMTLSTRKRTMPGRNFASAVPIWAGVAMHVSCSS